MNNNNLEYVKHMINKYKKEKEIIMNSLDVLTDNFICDLENIKILFEAEIHKYQIKINNLQIEKHDIDKIGNKIVKEINKNGRA